MKKRLSVALIAAVAVLSLTGCSPKGQDCSEKGKGTRLYTSQYGNFVCAEGSWPGSLVWKEA